MRAGFSFDSGSRGGALFATGCFYVRNRPQPSAIIRNVRRLRTVPSAVERLGAAIEGAFGEGFGWKRKRSELRATCKSTPSYVKQGWRNANLL